MYYASKDIRSEHETLEGGGLKVFKPIRVGAERLVVDAACELRERGHEVNFVLKNKAYECSRAVFLETFPSQDCMNRANQHSVLASLHRIASIGILGMRSAVGSSHCITHTFTQVCLAGDHFLGGNLCQLA